MRKTRDDAPFLLDPQGPAIQALLASYNQATGEDAEPFTMGGGTYAREFSRAASFGPEKPWEQAPEWVGGMHGPDEGVGAAAERGLPHLRAHYRQTHEARLVGQAQSCQVCVLKPPFTAETDRSNTKLDRSQRKLLGKTVGFAQGAP